MEAIWKNDLPEGLDPMTEVKPGGMLIGLLVFAPFVIGTVTAFTIGYGCFLGLLVMALAAARLDVTPALPSAPAEY